MAKILLRLEKHKNVTIQQEQRTKKKGNYSKSIQYVLLCFHSNLTQLTGHASLDWHCLKFLIIDMSWLNKNASSCLWPVQFSRKMMYHVINVNLCRCLSFICHCFLATNKMILKVGSLSLSLWPNEIKTMRTWHIDQTGTQVCQVEKWRASQR